MATFNFTADQAKTMTVEQLHAGDPNDPKFAVGAVYAVSDLVGWLDEALDDYFDAVASVQAQAVRRIRHLEEMIFQTHWMEDIANYYNGRREEEKKLLGKFTENIGRAEKENAFNAVSAEMTNLILKNTNVRHTSLFGPKMQVNMYTTRPVHYGAQYIGVVYKLGELQLIHDGVRRSITINGMLSSDTPEWLTTANNYFIRLAYVQEANNPEHLVVPADPAATINDTSILGTPSAL